MEVFNYLSSIYTRFCFGLLSPVEAAIITGGVLFLGSILYLFLTKFGVPYLIKITQQNPRLSTPKKIRLALLIMLVFGIINTVSVSLTGSATRLFLSIFYFALIYTLFEVALMLFVDYFIIKKAEIGFSPLFKDVLRTIVYLLSLMVILGSIYNVQLASLLTTSAVLSIIIGLAVQDSLGNFFSGFSLQVDRPFEVNDWVRVDGIECKVIEMNWRSAKFLTRENDVLCIPNNAVSKANLVNYTAPEAAHRCRKIIGVSYKANPNKVRNVLLKVLSYTREVLNFPSPKVFLTDYSDFSIKYEMWYWIKDYELFYEIENNIMNSIWYEFKRNGIVIPFPIRTIQFEKKQQLEDEKIYKLLKNIDFLAPLNEEEIKFLISEMHITIFGTNEVIFETNTRGNEFYIIKSGKIGIYHEEHDHRELIATLKEGDFFGEISLLTGQPRNAAAVAMEDVELILINRDTFAVMLENHPEVAREFSKIIAHRIAVKEKTATIIREKIELSKQQEKISEETQVADSIFSSIANLFNFNI